MRNKEIVKKVIIYGNTYVLSNYDKRIEPMLKLLKDLGVIHSWYFNGTYHAN